MSVSRISKAIAQIVRAENFGDVEGLRNKDIDIVCSLDDPGTFVMARAAAALGLRCFTGQLRIHIDRHNSPNRDRLEAVVTEEAIIYGATDRICFSGKAKGPWQLGINKPLSTGPYATASGWWVGINCSAGDLTDFVTPAHVFAISAAMAKLFGAAVLNQTDYIRENLRLSLWDFSQSGQGPAPITPSPSHCDIDLIGAGAIGSAFAYTLALLGWEAKLNVFDFDTYEDPNHETTMFLGYKDALKLPKKAVHLSKMLKGSSVEAAPFVTKITAPTALSQNWDSILVCAVDNPETRRLLDSATIKLLLNGAVGGTPHDAGWVLWSRHSTGDPPLSQFYSKDDEEIDTLGTHTPKDVAADDCTRMGYHGVSLAIPFVSLAAGALLAMGCGHQGLIHTEPINKLTFDLLRKASKFGATTVKAGSLTYR